MMIMVTMTSKIDLQLKVKSDTRQGSAILHTQHFNLSEEKFTFDTLGPEFETLC
jgi:hypothetical protein